MKHLKTYDDNINEPEIGDFVYCEVENGNYNPSNFIGVLLSNNKNERKKYPYRVQYKINNNSDTHENRLIKKDELVDFSKNEKDLDVYKNINKYNL